MMAIGWEILVPAANYFKKFNQFLGRLPSDQMKFSLRTLIVICSVMPIVGSIAFLWFFPPPRSILVAASDLSPFAELNPENTMIENMPSNSVPAEWPSDQNDINGKYIRYRADKGMPITNELYGTFTEIVDELREPPSPNTNIVTVEYLYPEQASFVSGAMPGYGDRIRLYRIQGERQVSIANNVRVLRNYQFNRKDYPNAFCLVGVELTDQQTIDYIDAKRLGRVEVDVVSIDGR